MKHPPVGLGGAGAPQHRRQGPGCDRPVAANLALENQDAEERRGGKLSRLAALLQLRVSGGGAQPRPGHEQGEAGPGRLPQAVQE